MTTPAVPRPGLAEARPAARAVTGWYLFGITPSTVAVPTVSVSGKPAPDEPTPETSPAGVLPDGMLGIGSAPGPVMAVRHREVAAVVSRIAENRALDSRRDILAHSRVLDGLASRTPVLPARFGMVLPDPDTIVTQLLAPRHDPFVRALNELAGQRQYTVSVRYLPEIALRELLAEDQEIRALRELTMAVNGYDLRIRLGELVYAALEHKRAADAQQVHATLDQHATRWLDRQPATEDDAASVAYLVEHDQASAFEHGAEDLAAGWTGRARVRLLGPTAPYDFADVVLSGCH